MFKSFFKTIIIAQQAAAAVKVLDYMTDGQLAELGHTRATFVEKIKNDFIASLEVEAAAKQNHAPVNANLAGAF
ncbi:MAG: hypothetical protein O3B33_06665 [Proteobacteria bacterium]|nr:hypothetical protein [Pseudomonadota bacterium]MDA1042969.1 hypothetical protein [Pseudomonadota bacterium]